MPDIVVMFFPLNVIIGIGIYHQIITYVYA